MKVPFAAFLAAALAALASSCQTPSLEMAKLAALPAPAQAGILKETKGGKITKVESATYKAMPATKVAWNDGKADKCAVFNSATGLVVKRD